jgi:hypothetical protein
MLRLYSGVHSMLRLYNCARRSGKEHTAIAETLRLGVVLLPQSNENGLVEFETEQGDLRIKTQTVAIRSLGP